MGETGEEGEESGSEPVARARAMTNAAAGAAVAESVVARLRARPGLVEKLARVVDEGLSATKRHYDSEEGGMVEAPDWAARRDFAKLALAYLEGMPTQMVVSASVGGPGQVPLGEILARAPNARRALQGFLARSGVVVDIAPASAPAGDRESPSGSGASAPS